MSAGLKCRTWDGGYTEKWILTRTMKGISCTRDYRFVYESMILLSRMVMLVGQSVGVDNHVLQKYWLQCLLSASLLLQTTQSWARTRFSRRWSRPLRRSGSPSLMVMDRLCGLPGRTRSGAAWRNCDASASTTRLRY